MTSRLLKLVIAAVFWLCWTLLRRLHSVLSGHATPGIWIVLYYHAVPDEARAGFVRQMNELQKRAEVIPAAWRQPLEAGKQYVSVTFDDALASAARNAFPELAQRGIHATVFVPTDFAGRTPDWIDDPHHPLHADRVLCIDELRRLAGPAITLGSHGVTHTNFCALDDAGVRRELEDSRRRLATIAEGGSEMFSFPYGAFAPEHLSAVRAAGYGRLFTTLPHVVYDPLQAFAVGRINVEPTDWAIEFQLKLAGAYQWLPTAIAIKRALHRVVCAGITRTCVAPCPTEPCNKT
jgi:peptidoglycan/xylan/chitin deacetylase (PgdA/CDA1 family)